jgi:hypothetical protein
VRTEPGEVCRFANTLLTAGAELRRQQAEAATRSTHERPAQLPFVPLPTVRIGPVKVGSSPPSDTRFPGRGGSQPENRCQSGVPDLTAAGPSSGGSCLPPIRVPRRTSRDVIAFEHAEPPSVEVVAERVFQRHNQEDRPDGRLCPSMSVGDVVVIGEVALSVAPVGFTQVDIDQSDLIVDESWIDVVGTTPASPRLSESILEEWTHPEGGPGSSEPPPLDVDQ